MARELPRSLPRAPMNYDQTYMNRLISQLERYVLISETPGQILATKARLTDLPTSSAGLSAGDLWNDTGTVKIV